MLLSAWFIVKPCREKESILCTVCVWLGVGGWGLSQRERERGVSMNVLHASQDSTVSWEASVPVMTYFILGHAGHHLMTQRVWLRSWRENVNTLDQTSQGFISPGRLLLRILGKTLKKTFRKNKNHIVLGWVWSFKGLMLKQITFLPIIIM